MSDGRVCPNCGHQIAAEPITDESIAEFVTLLETIQRFAESMEVDIVKGGEMMMRMAKATQKHATIGDLRKLPMPDREQ